MLSLTPLPIGGTIIGCKWQLKKKIQCYGSFQCHKARLLAKGFHQNEGFDYTETFNPVIKSSTIHIVFTKAIFAKWYMLIKSDQML